MVDIEPILHELFELDPGLREHEPALRQLVGELAASRPSIVPSPAFVAHLKQELGVRAAELAASRAAHTSAITSFFTMPKFVLTLGGIAAFILVVVVAASYLAVPGFSTRTVRPGTVAFAPSITRVGSHAFGDLSLTSSQAAPQGLSNSADTGAIPKAAPQPNSEVTSGINRAAMGVAAPSTITAPSGFGGGSPGSGLMRPYQPTPYHFVYQGEGLKDLAGQVEALKRMTGPENMPSAAALLGSLKFSGLDLASFSSLGLAQVTLNQNQAYGYSLSLDLMAGSLSVSQNWSTWPQPMQKCQDQACYDQLRLKPSDVPDDDAVVAIARDFAVAHGLSLANYGEPVITDDWRAQYLALPKVDQAQFYIPDSVTVLFPLKVNGQPVFDGGTQAGVGVGVSLRDKRASGLWNLTTQQYQASAYTAVADATQLVSYAEQGGYGNGWPVPTPYMKATPGSAPVTESAPSSEPANVAEPVPAIAPDRMPPPDSGGSPTPEGEAVGLGTPTMAYLKVWNYKPDGTSDELLVPALAFPITSLPKDVVLYQKFVLVPLVQDFWQQSVGGPIRYLPMMGQGSSGAASGSAGGTAPAVLPPTLKP